MNEVAVSTDQENIETAEDKAARLEAYNSIVKLAKLLDIKMSESKFLIKPEFYETRESELDSGKPRTKRELNWEFEPLVYDTDAGLLAGAFLWSVVVKKGRSRIFSAQGRYMIAYHDVPAVDEEPAFAFLQRVGRFSTYPYFRNFVAQMAWNAGADVPILPVLRG